MKINNQDAIDYLNSHLATWKRRDPWTFQVYTYGYVTQECVQLEEGLKELGYNSISRSYDKAYGSTVTIYKSA